jgi:hypothetical protein
MTVLWLTLRALAISSIRHWAPRTWSRVRVPVGLAELAIIGVGFEDHDGVTLPAWEPEFTVRTWAKIVLPWGMARPFLLAEYHRDHPILPIGQARRAVLLECYGRYTMMGVSCAW